MKEQIKLEEIVGYLPYGLKAIKESRSNYIGEPNEKEVININTKDVDILFSKRYKMVSCKPILRPLSDLTKEIEVNGEKFVPIKKLGDKYSVDSCMLYNHFISLDTSDSVSINILHYYYIIQKLYQWHFDIHNLIERGLAIDINNLEK